MRDDDELTTQSPMEFTVGAPGSGKILTAGTQPGSFYMSEMRKFMGKKILIGGLADPLTQAATQAIFTMQDGELEGKSSPWQEVKLLPLAPEVLEEWRLQLLDGEVFTTPRGDFLVLSQAPRAELEHIKSFLELNKSVLLAAWLSKSPAPELAQEYVGEEWLQETPLWQAVEERLSGEGE